jgi:hypothetical protein
MDLELSNVHECHEHPEALLLWVSRVAQFWRPKSLWEGSGHSPVWALISAS